MKHLVAGGHIFKSYHDHPDWAEFLEKIARYGFHILKTRETDYIKGVGTQIIAAHRRNRLLLVATSRSDMGTLKLLTGTIYGAVACDDLTPGEEKYYFRWVNHTPIENRISHFQITISDTDRDLGFLFGDLYRIGELQFMSWNMAHVTAIQSINLALEDDSPNTNEKIWEKLFKSGPNWFNSFVTRENSDLREPGELHATVRCKGHLIAFVTFTWKERPTPLHDTEYEWTVKIVDQRSSVNSPAEYEWSHSGLILTARDLRQFSRQTRKFYLNFWRGMPHDLDGLIFNIRQVLLSHYGWIAIHMRWPK